MTKADIAELKRIFTMKNEDIGDLITDLEVDPFDVMKAIITFTTNPQDFSKVDEFSKLVYVTKEAYKQGFMAALFYANETNKDAIAALAEGKDVSIA